MAAMDLLEHDPLFVQVPEKVLGCMPATCNGVRSESTHFVQIIPILFNQNRGSGDCCFWPGMSDQSVRDQISFQCPDSSCETGIGLDESSPTIVENRMGQITDFFHMTAAKVGIHMLEHANRIAA